MKNKVKWDKLCLQKRKNKKNARDIFKDFFFNFDQKAQADKKTKYVLTILILNYNIQDLILIPLQFHSYSIHVLLQIYYNLKIFTVLILNCNTNSLNS